MMFLNSHRDGNQFVKTQSGTSGSWHNNAILFGRCGGQRVYSTARRKYFVTLPAAVEPDV